MSQMKLIGLVIYILFITNSIIGQSCDGLTGHMQHQVRNIITGTGIANAIYSSYSSSGNCTWASSNWTGQVDFTGIAFDNNRAGTLISPRHILMAHHYQRSIGSVLVFHDSTGTRHTATLIAKQSVPGGTNPDITVGLLDVDVPVTFYKVLPVDSTWGDCLKGALVVSTHHNRKASIREVNSTNGRFISFRSSYSVPPSYYAPVISGNSGNPNFLIRNGEPILISTFTYGGWGSGPFFSEPSNFNAINSIMTSLGGGYQLEEYTCPADYAFSGNGGIDSTQSGSFYYETDGPLESTQTISSSGIVGYDSGTTIELLPGFEVTLGAKFETYINGCGNQ